MIYLSRTEKFSSAHFIKGAGLCSNIHGHNYTVIATIKGELTSKWLMDAKELKRLMWISFLTMFNHTLLNDVVDFEPTAEKLCIYMFDELSKVLPKNVKMHSIELIETEKIKAVYYGF